MDMTEERKEKFKKYKDFWENVNREELVKEVIYVDFNTKTVLNTEEVA